MTTELHIPGFNITSVLQHTGRKILVRAFDFDAKKLVLLKVLLGSVERHILRARLKREFELINRFTLQTMAKPLSIIESEEHMVAVLEDFGHSTLKDYSAQYPLPIKPFLHLAITIIKGVAELHHNGVNHTRLYPGNILVDTQTLEVKLLDLETASLLRNESAETLQLNAIDEEIPYLAPEQSGRMNRRVDLRSNLYSLGCIFYEMLAGQPVFRTENIVELIHAHMAKSPKPLTELNPLLPQPINDIVLKLLNKNAEDRYQSILGLLRDMEHCQQQWEQHKYIEPFELGRYDISDQLSFPQKLYGRDDSLRVMTTAYETVKKGQFALLLLGGYSGIGKTSLVMEFRKQVVAENAMFISGKYDQLEKNMAFSALMNALRQYVQQKLSQNRKFNEQFISRLIAALGGQGQVIIEVLPELELLIGPQDKQPTLPVAEAQNRFLDVLCRFVGCFASPTHPLVIFIDDLQWADLSTINFITRLSQFQHNQHIFFIGAYRNNEVTSVHPLMLSLTEMRALQVPLWQFILHPLSENEVNEFLADTLQRPPRETQELAAIIGKKTGANPFFLKLFVNRLLEKDLISFEVTTLRWEWNIQKVRQAGITDNVVELLTQNLERLPVRCQDVLKHASCLGNHFDLRGLCQVMGLSAPEVAKALWLPLSQNYVVPLDESYKIVESLEAEHVQNVSYRFAHDRAQQAAYRLLGSKERLSLHLGIARKLHERVDGAALQVKLFDIVNHFNLALPQIDDPQLLRTVRELNLQAGDKAYEATSFSTALQFYRIAVSLFEEGDWTRDHDVMVQAQLKLAECEYISGAYEAADSLYALILNKTKDEQYRARVYDIQLRQYAQQGRNKETLQRGVSILKKYGVRFIAEPSLLQLIPTLLHTKWMVWRSDVNQFYSLPPIRRKKKAYAIQTLMNISATAYVYNANTMLLLVLRMLQLSIKYGNAPESTFGYGLYGFVEGAALGNAPLSKKFADLSIRLAEHIESPIIRAKVKFLRAFSTQHWFEPIPSAIPELLEAFKMLDQSGSYTFAGYSLQAMMAKRLYLGEGLTRYHHDLLEFSQYADRVQEYYTQNLLLVLNSYVSGMSGHWPEGLKEHPLHTNEEAYLQELRERRLLMPVAWHYVYNQMRHYQLGDLAKAKAYAKKARIVDDAAPTTMAQIEHHFYNVLIYAEDYPRLSFSQRMVIRLRAKWELSKLRKWARDCPENFMLRYRIARLAWKTSRNPSGQDTNFAALVQLAGRDTNEQLSGLSHEMWARHLYRQGKIARGNEQMHLAIKKYMDWGADLKAEQLRQQYLATGPGVIAPANGDQGSLDVRMDVEAILKAFRVISGDILLGKLLSNLLNILMENAGAQRGCLILNTDEQLLIEAEHRIDQEEPEVLQSKVLTSSNQVSTAIANFIHQTGENVLLDDAQLPNNFSTDLYLEENQVRSVLGVPIKNKGKISAIIYLENNLATKVFTTSRLNMVTMLAAQAAISLENAMLYNSLEQKVADRTLELSKEKKKTDELLLNILPAEIAEELKEKGEASTQLYQQATILFADFRDFTFVAESMNPKDLVQLIDFYFRQFDEIVTHYHIEKIKTVGDAYIAAGGLPDPRQGPPLAVVKAAIDMQNFTRQIAREKEKTDAPYFEVRIGIHTGPVIAGVVGKLKFAYDIWGDTVNIAARLEQHGLPGKINISGTTHAAIKKHYPCTYRGKIDAKNKGKIDMFFVDYDLK